MARRCPVCRAERTERVFESPRLPVHVGLLYRSREDAVACATGDIRLDHCSECDLIFNAAFDPARVRYAGHYDNALHFSPTFRAYSRRTAERLVDSYGIRKTRVLEIGSGSGDFLRLLVELGDNVGLGIDPGAQPASASDGALTFLKEPFQQRHLQFDPGLICARHVLEHLEDPVELLRTIQEGLRRPDDALIYLEVPNGLATFRSLSVWDIIYEHCIYFTPLALGNLLESATFVMSWSAETYDGQFLAADARPGTGMAPAEGPTNTIEETRAALERFAREYESRVETWRQELRRRTEAGSRVIVWGAGARGTSLLNLAGDPTLIDYVVDINPGKQGCYMPGTGHAIVAPGRLREAPPELIVMCNPIYRDEVAHAVEALGVRAQIAVV